LSPLALPFIASIEGEKEALITCGSDSKRKAIMDIRA